MNRSYSKKRHIQESNLRLEKRYLNEDTLSTAAYGLSFTTEAQRNHIYNLKDNNTYNPNGYEYRKVGNDKVDVLFYPTDPDSGEFLRKLRFNLTDKTIKWYNGCEYSKGGSISLFNGRLEGGWMLDKNNNRIDYKTGISSPAKYFGDEGQTMCKEYKTEGSGWQMTATKIQDTESGGDNVPDDKNWKILFDKLTSGDYGIWTTIDGSAVLDSFYFILKGQGGSKLKIARGTETFVSEENPPEGKTAIKGTLVNKPYDGATLVTVKINTGDDSEISLRDLILNYNSGKRTSTGTSSTSTHSKSASLTSTSWDECSGTYHKGCKSSNGVIAKVQGCLKIKADGKFGSGTQSAVKTKIGTTTFTDADVDKLCSKTEIGGGGARPPETNQTTSSDDVVSVKLADF